MKKHAGKLGRDLDQVLIHKVRGFITGENVHRVETWLFAYETSYPDTTMRARSESILRDFLVTQEKIGLARRFAQSAVELSRSARDKSDTLRLMIDLLEERERSDPA